MRVLLSASAALAALCSPPASAQSSAPAAPPPACQAAEHRQFDFWVGEWDVFTTGKAPQVATSRIEALHGGCVVRESWMPLKGTSGTSLNMYDAADAKWRQTWVDASGGWVEFTGGMTGATMVLTGNWRGAAGPGKDALTRMTYSKGVDGAVRQFGEQSVDGGASWSPSFDFTYRRKTTPR